MDWGMAQVVEHLLCKWKVQTPIPPKERNKERNKKPHQDLGIWLSVKSA
jgi:hypothetical protein